MQAADVMTKDPVTISPDTRVEDIAALLLDRHISAVPVVDAGKLVGMVSEGDLMCRPEGQTSPRHSWWLNLLRTSAENAAEYLKSHGGTAGAVMSTELVTVAPDTPVCDIAELLEARNIKRVPVIEGGKVVGIVSRADLLRALAAQKAVVPTTAPTDDRALRDAVVEVLRAEHLPADNVNPVVNDGVVHLWGVVRADEEKKAIALAVQSTPGVKSVVDNVGVLDRQTRSVMWAE